MFPERRAGCAVLLLLLIGCCNGEVTVTSQPVNATTCTGEAATFECLAEGNFSTIASQNSIVWKRFITQSGDYKSLMPQSKYSSFVSFNNRFASLTGTLIIKNVTTDDEGWYVLKVGSDMMSNRAYLNVVTAADVVPVITEVTTINSSMFTVNWIPSDPNYNYTVIWTNLHTGVMYNGTVPGNTNSSTVTGLSGDVNYNVSVAAVNQCGMMTSDPVTVYDTPDKPTNITFSQRACTSFMVQWDEVLDMFPVTYKVSWSDGNDDNGTITTNQTSYTITGLTYNSAYNVTVVAINTCCGAGPTSYTLLTTNTSMPMTPIQPTKTVTITLPPVEHTTTTTSTTTKTVQITMTTVIKSTGKLADDDECSCTSLVGGVIAGFIGVIAVIMIIVIIILLVYWCYYNKRKGEPGNDQIVYDDIYGTRHDSISKDSISKDSIDLPVFKPQMTSRVIEDYSEVVNCARPPKAVRHKSSSSRTKSNSDSIKEKPEETPLPLGSYETITMNDNSSIPRQAIANGTEYALSTRMTPANVARTYSEPKKVDGVQQQQTDDVQQQQQQATTTGNGHLTTSDNAQQQQTATSGNGHLTTSKISSSMAYEQVA